MIRSDIPVMETRERRFRSSRNLAQRGQRPRMREVEEEPDEEVGMQLMKAAAIDGFGEPDVMTSHTLPVPELGPRDVLIEVHAAGVGVWDAAMRGGWWPKGRPKFPLVLGADGAGIVVAKGQRVRRLAVGDHVWASELANPKGGFNAEFTAVHTSRVGLIPKRLDMLHAGASAVTALTALQGIDEKLHVREGQTILIFGASGAVGTLAVQFAKRLNARVIGTATGRDATALVRRLGADEVVDARSRKFVSQLRSLVPDGIDGILALAGGEALEGALQLMRAGGRAAFPNGVEPVPSARPLIRLIHYDVLVDPRHFERLERAVDEAKLEVPIAAQFPLAQASKAHERLERGHVLGRIVLRIK